MLLRGGGGVIPDAHYEYAGFSLNLRRQLYPNHDIMSSILTH